MGKGDPGKGNVECQDFLNALIIRKAVRRLVRQGRVSKRNDWKSHISGTERKIRRCHRRVPKWEKVM